jgi:hypothetical protein
MAATITIDPGLDDAQLSRLAEIFGRQDADLDALLGLLAAAALEEYALAFTGERAPGTIREVRELRLRLLYGHLPVGEPTDEQIGRLFQMTPSQVSTLIAGTRARFDVDLGDRLRAAAIEALRTSEHVDEDTVRIVVPDSLARYLRDLVAQTSAPPLERRKDASRTYDLGRTTVVALSRQLGIDPKGISSLDWPA